MLNVDGCGLIKEKMIVQIVKVRIKISSCERLNSCCSEVMLFIFFIIVAHLALLKVKRADQCELWSGLNFLD